MSLPLRLPRPDRGVVLVLSGPSGVGKSTLIDHLRARVPDLAFSVSATTRAPRQGEVDGVHYRFLDDATFVRLIDEGAFLEHAQVYGHRYGTPREAIEARLAEGHPVLLDIDVQGSQQIRQTLPEAVHAIVLPPSLQELERRLRSRNTDSDEVIRRRLAEAHDQIRGAPGYDYLLVNDDLESSCAQLEAVLLAELCRTSRQQGRLTALIRDLRRGRSQ